MQKMNYDVLVAGGGSAGIAAAVAASSLGAKVLLVESHGTLGGMATSALVHTICGLYRLDGRFANPGFASFFADRLIQSGGAYGPVKMGHCHVLPHDPFAFAVLADEVVETAGVDTYLHTAITAADIQTRTVELSSRGSNRFIQAKAWIDTTGDASLAHLAGLPTEMESAQCLQRPAYVFGVIGVPEESCDDSARLRWSNHLVQGVVSNRLPEDVLAATLHGSGRGGLAMITLNLNGGSNYQPLDPECLTKLEQQGRQLAATLINFFRSSDSEFKNIRIAAFPTQVGIRESRRILGNQRMETQDFEEGKSYEDEIAKASWPMETREKATTMRLRFPRDEKFCGIPLGALQVQNQKGILVAGRCISSSHEVQASIRVIGTCLTTGEAAGITAALIVDQDKLPTAKVIQIKRSDLLARGYRRVTI